METQLNTPQPRLESPEIVFYDGNSAYLAGLTNKLSRELVLSYLQKAAYVAGLGTVTYVVIGLVTASNAGWDMAWFPQIFWFFLLLILLASSIFWIPALMVWIPLLDFEQSGIVLPACVVAFEAKVNYPYRGGPYYTAELTYSFTNPYGRLLTSTTSVSSGWIGYVKPDQTMAVIYLDDERFTIL